MLRSIFFGSIMVYVLVWIRGRLSNVFACQIITLGVVFLSYILFGGTAFMVLVGACIFWADRYLKKTNRQIWLLAFMAAVCMAYGLHYWLFEMIVNVVDLPEVFDYTTLGRILYSTVMFIAIGQNGLLQKIFSCGFFVRLGQISYPVFLIHWPLMCSLSTWMLCRISSGFVVKFWVTLVVTTTVLILIAWMYQRTAGTYCDFLCRKIKKCFDV